MPLEPHNLKPGQPRHLNRGAWVTLLLLVIAVGFLVGFLAMSVEIHRGNAPRPTAVTVRESLEHLP